MADNWSDWGLEDSFDFPGSDSFDVPLTLSVVGSGGLGAMWDPNTFRYELEHGDFLPSDWGSSSSLDKLLGPDWLSGLKIPSEGFKLTPAAEKILFEDLPYISDTFYGADKVIPGQLGGFNPDVGPIGFKLGQDPGYYLDQYGFGIEDLLPNYADTKKIIESFDSDYADTKKIIESLDSGEEPLGPSGREQINTTPGGGSTANTGTQVPGLPGTPSGPSVREPSTTNTSETVKPGSTSTGKTSTGGTSIGSVLGGLAAAGLLAKVLGLFDSSGSGDKYTGIKMPKLSDIPRPDTPQIAPVRVVPVPVQVPVVSDDVKGALVRNLGSTPLARGGLAAPLYAHGGRLDFRHGAPVVGEGTGQSDDIPALLSDGEFVIPADCVSALGDGSNKAGADKLYEMMHEIRKRARSTDSKDLPPKAKSPLQYMSKQKNK